MDFPAALKERRASRRLSQLELALRAGTTQRHLSFIESGRSPPGREMVIRLAESLGLPLRERNELLLKAGYAPAYPETPLDSPGLAPLLAALSHILDAHMPYPAIVIDPCGEIVAANAGQRILAGGCVEHLRGNAYRLALHPDGMAPQITNVADWARHVLNGIAAELIRNPRGPGHRYRTGPGCRSCNSPVRADAGGLLRSWASTPANATATGATPPRDGWRPMPVGATGDGRTAARLPDPCRTGRVVSMDIIVRPACPGDEGGMASCG